MLKHFLYSIIIILCGSCSEGAEVNPPVSSLPIISIVPLSVIEGNQNKSFFISLRLNKSSDETVTVVVMTEDNSAVSGEDYVGFESKQAEFSPGALQENIRIDIIGDEDFEQTEDFKVKIIDVTGATIGSGEAAFTIENDDINNQFIIPGTGYTTPLTYDGMDLVWQDEFDGEELNEQYWTYEIGNGSSGWGNNELEYYRKENTSLYEGNLVIQAREENYNGFQYTSSRLVTKNKYEFTFGRVDIRAVIPEGQGIWPALWTLGENISTVGWPECGEIDIMELIGNEPSTVHGTIHYADPNGNRILNGHQISLSNGKKFSSDFHVFSMVWKENSVKWYMDDMLYHSITDESLGTDNPYPFNDPFFFIFNVAVGGDWPGNPNSSTVFPQNMFVDYIRVFQEK